MSDLIDDPQPGANAPEFTVSEISGAIKKTLEGEFGRVRVKGEVGRVFRASSGHLYYDIKDNKSVLACTTWKGQIAHLSVVPEEGLEVVVTGKLSAFGPQSKYNLNVDQVSVAGAGALMAMLEKRKQALAKEGLFDQSQKRPIPFLPNRIGVITSPQGAVIRDILHRLADRFPREVSVWPVAVQGERCAPEVTRALDGFNAMPPDQRPDLIIVARGGGSIEDLWGFNEEIVVRAVARSSIPVISAVGHETDTTLIDFVSDQRAPTPTAAAEMAVPVRAELMAGLASLEARRVRALGSGVENRKQRLRDVARALPNAQELLRHPAQSLDHLTGRLPNALQMRVGRARASLSSASGGLRPIILANMVSGQERQLNHLATRITPAFAQKISQQRVRLDGLERLRNTLGYKETLKRGYAVVRDGHGELISSRDVAKDADGIELEFADGRISLDRGDAPKTKPKTSKKTPKADPSDQGSLF